MQEVPENKYKIKSYLRKISAEIDRKEVIILALIFLGSMLIRWIGLKHGFPLLTHPDESWIMDPLVKMTRTKTLFPGNLNRPNLFLYKSLFFYLNTLSYLRFGENLAAVFSQRYINFYFYARIFISFMGSLIPIVVYKIGKLFKQNFALPSALVFALFPSYVLHSLYITPDIPITLFTILIIYFTLRYLIKNDEKSIYIAVVFSALNTTEKYPGLISLGIIFTGIILKNLDSGDKSWGKIVWGSLGQFLVTFAVFFVALFLFAPNLFIKLPIAIDALIVESRSTHLGADNLGWIGNLLFYIRSFGSWTNLLSVLWISLGIHGLIKDRDKSSLILLYGLLYWLLMSVLSLHWERWALPMYITPLFLTAFGIGYAWQRFRSVSVIKHITAILIGGFFIYQFITTLHTPISMSFKDTRVEALSYCRENGITKNNALYEGYTPLLPESPKTIFDSKISAFTEKDYIILSSSMFNRYYNEPERFINQIQYYNNLRKEHDLVKIFEPSPTPSNIHEKVVEINYYLLEKLKLASIERFKGPIIEIYQINN